LTGVTRSPVKLSEVNGVALWIWAPPDPLSLGNKRFKLKPAIDPALTRQCESVLSFGGAYSNHLHALSILAGEAGLRSVGVVRGEASAALNPTLSDARRCGMQLEFVSRSEYRRRHDPNWQDQWREGYPGALLIDEGGSSEEAVRACTAMLDDVPAGFLHEIDVIACACGTGATVSGLFRRYRSSHLIRAYDVVGDASTTSRLTHWCTEPSTVTPGSSHSPDAPALVDASYGGYAVSDARQYQTIEHTMVDAGVLLDPIYTAKVCRRLEDDIEAGIFSSGTSVLPVHTGGLQGWRGKFREATGYLQRDTLMCIRDELQQLGLSVEHCEI